MNEVKTRPPTTDALLEQAQSEHEAAAHVLHRQGGTEGDAIKCVLRAQMLLLEVLKRLSG